MMFSSFWFNHAPTLKHSNSFLRKQFTVVKMQTEPDTCVPVRGTHVVKARGTTEDCDFSGNESVAAC